MGRVQKTVAVIDEAFQKAQREKVRAEYEAATLALTKRIDVNGKLLCARGRVYRAVRMAPNINPESLPAFKAKFGELADEAERLINEYNFHLKAYWSFCAFGGAEPECIDLPDCDCEGCNYGN